MLEGLKLARLRGFLKVELLIDAWAVASTRRNSGWFEFIAKY